MIPQLELVRSEKADAVNPLIHPAGKEGNLRSCARLLQGSQWDCVCPWNSVRGSRRRELPLAHSCVHARRSVYAAFSPTKFTGSHFNWPVNNQSAPHLLPVCPTALFQPSSLLPRFRGDGFCKSNACVCSKHLRCILWILLSSFKEPLLKLVTLFDCFSILKGE